MDDPKVWNVVVALLYRDGQLVEGFNGNHDGDEDDPVSQKVSTIPMVGLEEYQKLASKLDAAEERFSDVLSQHGEAVVTIKALESRLGTVKAVLVELHDDHQDSDTFDAGADRL
jgi:hypothetical protein